MRAHLDAPRLFLCAPLCSHRFHVSRDQFTRVTWLTDIDAPHVAAHHTAAEAQGRRVLMLENQRLRCVCARVTCVCVCVWMLFVCVCTSNVCVCVCTKVVCVCVHKWRVCVCVYDWHVCVCVCMTDMHWCWSLIASGLCICICLSLSVWRCPCLCPCPSLCL